MKKIIVFLLLSLVIYSQKEIKVGIYQNKPLVFLDEDKIVKGIYIDIIEDIAKKENLKISYVLGSWQECLDRLEKGKTDIQVAIAFSEIREKKYDFTNTTFLSNWAQIYIQERSDIESILELNNKRIAVLKGDIYYQKFKMNIEKFGINAKFIELNSYIDIFKQIESNKADAGIISRIFGLQYEEEYKVKRSVIIANPVELRVASKKGKDKDILRLIDKNLKLYREDKTSIYYQSLNKWLYMNKQENIIKLSSKNNKILIALLILVISTLLFINLFFMIKNIKKSDDEKVELQNESGISTFELMNILSDIIITTDERGNVLNCNIKAIDYFKIDNDKKNHIIEILKNKEIEDYFQQIPKRYSLKNLKVKEMNVKGQEIYLKIDIQEYVKDKLYLIVCRPMIKEKLLLEERECLKNKLKNVINFFEFWYFEINNEWEIIQSEGESKNILGIESEKLLNRNFQGIFFEDVLVSIKEELKKKNKVDFEFQTMIKNEKTRLKIAIIPIKSKENSFFGMVHKLD